MFLLVHSKDSHRRIHFHVGAKRAAAVIDMDGLERRGSSADFEEFSVVVAKGGEPHDMLEPLNQSVEPETPSLDASDITGHDVADDDDKAVLLLRREELRVEPLQLEASVVLLTPETEVEVVAGLRIQSQYAELVAIRGNVVAIVTVP